MKKLLEFSEKISKVYGIIYISFIHIAAIHIIALTRINFNKPMPDIILGYIVIILVFAVCDLCFLIPSIGLIAMASLISFLMVISIPLFLFFSLFEIIGSQSINILQFGFIKTLLICILITPIGLMNIKVLTKIMK